MLNRTEQDKGKKVRTWAIACFARSCSCCFFLSKVTRRSCEGWNGVPKVGSLRELDSSISTSGDEDQLLVYVLQ